MKEQVKDYIMTNDSGSGVYVGTYKKYNEGSLFGAWIDLEKFTDAGEFFDVCCSLHDDEDDPEFMFQDYQGFPEELYGESMSVDEVQEILDYLALDDDKKEMLEDYVQCFNVTYRDIDKLLEDAEDRVQGQYDDFDDFATQTADEQLSCCKVPDFITRYFDYKSFANDLSYDYEIGDHGYIFRTC